MGQVVERCSLAIAVIKRYRGRQTEQFTLVLTPGANRAAVSADVVSPLAALRTQSHFGFIGTGFAAGRPEHENVPPVDVVGSRERVIMGLDRRIAQIQQVLLYRIDGIGPDALGWQNWAAILFLDAEDDVSTAQIVEVVGEGADGVQHALRVPARFVLNAFAFDGALAKQVVYVDGQFAGHAVAFSRLRFVRLLT